MVVGQGGGRVGAGLERTCFALRFSLWQFVLGGAVNESTARDLGIGGDEGCTLETHTGCEGERGREGGM